MASAIRRHAAARFRPAVVVRRVLLAVCVARRLKRRKAAFDRVSSGFVELTRQLLPSQTTSLIGLRRSCSRGRYGMLQMHEHRHAESSVARRERLAREMRLFESLWIVDTPVQDFACFAASSMTAVTSFGRDS